MPALPIKTMISKDHHHNHTIKSISEDFLVDIISLMIFISINNINNVI